MLWTWWDWYFKNCNFFLAVMKHSGQTVSTNFYKLSSNYFLKLLKWINGNDTKSRNYILCIVLHLFCAVSSITEFLIPFESLKMRRAAAGVLIFFFLTYSFIYVFILHLVCFPVAPPAKMKIIHQSRIRFWFILPSFPRPPAPLLPPSPLSAGTACINLGGCCIDKTDGAMRGVFMDSSQG